MKFTPTNNRLVVEELPEETNGSAIILVAKDAYYKRGKVISTSNSFIAPKPGDLIAYGKYAGIQISDNQYLIRPEDILGTLSDYK